MPDDPGVGDELTLLGAEGVTKPSKRLETFPNRDPDRPYLVSLECPEFTCVCPMTGQPDFAINLDPLRPGPAGSWSQSR